FDAQVYAQSGASSPPAGIALPAVPTTPPPRVPKPADEPLYLAIDPRIHWPQRHSEKWHAAKQDEIKRRRTRKANFGRAAESLRRWRQQSGGGLEETLLPEKISTNADWVTALRRLRGGSTGQASFLIAPPGPGEDLSPTSRSSPPPPVPQAAAAYSPPMRAEDKIEGEPCGGTVFRKRRQLLPRRGIRNQPRAASSAAGPAFTEGQLENPLRILPTFPSSGFDSTPTSPAVYPLSYKPPDYSNGPSPHLAPVQTALLPVVADLSGTHVFPPSRGPQAGAVR
ncbi:hypothetical protein C8A05DRAFT_18031, partial [Staphylotrichum tortipilum]